MDRTVVAYLYGLVWVCALITGEEGVDCPDCGRCKDDVPCSVTSCTCPDGCHIYWLGDDCSIEIPPVPDPDGLSTWVQSSTRTTLVIIWDTIQTLPSKYLDNYGYQVTYRRRQGVNSLEMFGPRVRHSDLDTLSAVVSGLEPGTEYIIAVWPYRIMDKQMPDYGTPYDRIIGRTASDGTEVDDENVGGHDEDEDGNSVVPWILFGISLIIIIALVIVIVLLYLKYVRRKPKSPKPNSSIWIRPPADVVDDTVTPSTPHQDNRPTNEVTSPGRTQTGVYDQTIVPMTTPQRQYDHLTNRNFVYENSHVNVYDELKK